MDKRDVIIGIMGITIIALVHTLFFSVSNDIIMSDATNIDSVSELSIVWQGIICAIFFSGIFLYLYLSWHFSVGSKSKH